MHTYVQHEQSSAINNLLYENVWTRGLPTTSCVQQETAKNDKYNTWLMTNTTHD